MFITVIKWISENGKIERIYKHDLTLKKRSLRTRQADFYNISNGWGGGRFGPPQLWPYNYIEAFALTLPNFLTFSLWMLAICKKKYDDRITLKGSKEVCLTNIFVNISIFLGFLTITLFELFGIVLKIFFVILHHILQKNRNFEKN